MATVNFSVPDSIKETFNKAFEGKGKSTITARLMKEAVEEKERLQRRRAVIGVLTRTRKDRPAIADEGIRRILEEIRL